MRMVFDWLHLGLLSVDWDDVLVYLHPHPAHVHCCCLLLLPPLPPCQQLGSALVQLTKLNLCQMSGISFQNVRGFGALRELDLTRCDQLATSAITTAVESLE